MAKERNYKKYRPYVIETLKAYINGEIDNCELNTKLHKIQNELGFRTQRLSRAVWIQLNDDCKGYWINRIWSDIKFGTTEEKNNMIGLIQSAIDNPKWLRIYYS
jgi:hypothetical protein